MLDPFERVVWSGKPEKKAYLLPAFGGIFIFLLFASIISLMVYTALYSAYPPGIFWILPIGISLIMGLIPPWWQSKKYPGVEYMITDKRLLVKSGDAKEDVWFTDLSRIKDSIVKTGLSDKILGTGKLYPITPEYPYAPKMHAYTEGGMYRLKKVYNIVEGRDEEVSEIELFRKSQTHPHLKGLKEPYAVQKLLEEAIFKKKQTS